MAARKWTDEQKAKQAELIHAWKPWQHSTGATTEEGKAIVSRNAFRYTARKGVLFSKWLYRQVNNLQKGKPYANDEECKKRLLEAGFETVFIKKLEK